MEDSPPRYQRQCRLPEIGPEGQKRLAAATVAVVGLGALGSVGADLLARAGIGRLLLIDRDVVELSNLQRQLLYDESDVSGGLPKAEAARRRLQKINSSIHLDAHPVDLTALNLPSLFDGVDLVLDGTDNFGTRYLLNDWAVENQRPYLYAGVVATYGMVGAILPPAGPCLRCAYPEPPAAADTPTCRSAGVLGPAVAVVAGWAAAEALKILVGDRANALHGFLSLDVWHHEWRRLRVESDPQCPCCGQGKRPWLNGQRGARGAEALCGGGAVQVPADGTTDLAQLQRKLAGTVSDLQAGPSFVRFRCQDCEVIVFADGRALVRGTEDPARARALLAETVGA